MGNVDEMKFREQRSIVAEETDPVKPTRIVVRMWGIDFPVPLC